MEVIIVTGAKKDALIPLDALKFCSNTYESRTKPRTENLRYVRTDFELQSLKNKQRVNGKKNCGIVECIL